MRKAQYIHLLARALRSDAAEPEYGGMLSPCGLRVRLDPAVRSDGSVEFTEPWQKFYILYYAFAAAVVVLGVIFAGMAIVDREPSLFAPAAVFVGLGAGGVGVTYLLGRRVRRAKVGEGVTWSFAGRETAEPQAVVYVCDLAIKTGIAGKRGHAVVLTTPNYAMTLFLSFSAESAREMSEYLESLPAAVLERVSMVPRKVRSGVRHLA